MSEKLDPREPLVDAAMQLRAAAPEQWAKFVHEIGKEAIRTNASMVGADPALLLRAQGMALQANNLAAMLANAPEIHEKIYEARMKRNARTDSR